MCISIKCLYNILFIYFINFEFFEAKLFSKYPKYIHQPYYFYVVNDKGLSMFSVTKEMLNKTYKKISMKLLFQLNAWTLPFSKYNAIKITASRLIAAFDPYEVVFKHFLAHFVRYLGDNLTNVGFSNAII